MFSSEGFCPASVGVSRETMEGLIRFVSLLERWNQKLNLVSSGSLEDVWERHVRDSAQLAQWFPRSARRYLDIGSGAGFPGLVLALCLRGEGMDLSTTLVESDRRKAEFLRHAIRELGLTAKVISERIERCEPLHADVITARAVAPLSHLLGFAVQQLGDRGRALFPKGRNWNDEIRDARQFFRFEVTPHQSSTDSSAAVLEIWDIRRG